MKTYVAAQLEAYATVDALTELKEEIKNSGSGGSAGAAPPSTSVIYPSYGDRINIFAGTTIDVDYIVDEFNKVIESTDEEGTTDNESTDEESTDEENDKLTSDDVIQNPFYLLINTSSVTKFELTVGNYGDDEDESFSETIEMYGPILLPIGFSSSSVYYQLDIDAKLIRCL